MPTGADCVVQVEDTKLLHEAEGGREELQIEVLVAPTVNQDIRLFNHIKQVLYLI